MTSDGLICDSSSLISLTGSCLDSVLYFLRDEHGMKFYVPPSVEEECITRPLGKNLKEHAFSARKIEKAIRDNVLIRTEGNAASMKQVLDCANNLFFMRGRPLLLVHEGEAEMLSFASSIGATSFLIDERTTRMLVEAPFRLKEHLELEFNVNIMLDKNNLSRLAEISSGIEIIRASELLILAYEHGFMNGFGNQKKDALEAALYKIKYAGCSIRFDEIDQFIRSL